jgi:hypothetical protein
VAQHSPRGKEDAPRRSALPQVSRPTGYVQAFTEVRHHPQNGGNSTPKQLDAWLYRIDGWIAYANSVVEG